MENSIVFSDIAGIASFISVVFGIIDYISKYANDFRSKRKPLFFVRELYLIGFSDKQKQYYLNGRLVSKDEVEYESIKVGFISSNHYWEREGKYYRCENGERKEGDYGTALTIVKDYSDGDTLKIESKDLKTIRDYSYEIEGEYVIVDVDEKKDKYVIKKEDIIKSLTIKATVKDKDGKGKDIEIKPIKCPNIRTSKMIGYIILSVLFIFIGVITTSHLICNWRSYFVSEDIGSILLFSICGVLLFLITVYFFVANIKCVSQLLILIKMKKFGVPRKTKIVSDTLLISKTWQFMAGSEKVDNIL